MTAAMTAGQEGPVLGVADARAGQGDARLRWAHAFCYFFYCMPPYPYPLAWMVAWQH